MLVNEDAVTHPVEVGRRKDREALRARAVLEVDLFEPRFAAALDEPLESVSEPAGGCLSADGLGVQGIDALRRELAGVLKERSERRPAPSDNAHLTVVRGQIVPDGSRVG